MFKRCRNIIDNVPIIIVHHVALISIKIIALVLYSYMLEFLPRAVTGSIALTASNYDAYESDGQVSVCAAINAAALERDVVVQLSSQDSTARSKFFITSTYIVNVNFLETIKRMSVF